MFVRTVEDQLQSPYHDVRILLERYRAGDLDEEGFIRALDEYDERLQVLYEGVAAEPEGLEVEEDMETLGEAVEGIHMFSDVSERLRDYAEEGAEELATEALELARKAHDRWAELVEVRGDLLTLLEGSEDYLGLEPSLEEY
ncbi:MAG: hypothetical protein AB7S38_14115 [Vulcanimicrobiota bacterium]